MPTTLFEAVQFTQQLSYQRWVSQEFFSFGWYFAICSRRYQGISHFSYFYMSLLGLVQMVALKAVYNWIVSIV